MTRINRIENFLIGLLMIAGSIALAINPEESLPVITAIMSVSLWIYGIRMMVYYLMMARHMVGGLRVLFRGILCYGTDGNTAFVCDALSGSHARNIRGYKHAAGEGGNTPGGSFLETELFSGSR